ncbi:MAG: hypothetical protein WC139_00645 [Candidatus Kapaibacterium sp.]
MKNLLYGLIMLTVIASCTNSQDVSTNEWSAIQYFYNSGPLPPPYHYSFDININNNGESSLNYRLGYDEQKPPINYTFNITKENLKLLSGKIKASELASGKIEAVPENQHPVGGSLERVRLVITKAEPDLDQPPKAFESPYFPTEKYKKNLEELYSFINKLVPDSVWSDVKAKKSEYESKNKN